MKKLLSGTASAAVLAAFTAGSAQAQGPAKAAPAADQPSLVS